MPEQASTLAPEIDFVFNVITWISIFFFVLIVALLVIFVLKYRRTNGRRPEESPTHHTALELTWTIIPLILVIVIFYYGMQGYIIASTPPVGAYEVNVTAQKWSWRFEHRNGARETAELVVPANRPVRLIMTSQDVLHSLFIPAFRVKQDVVPGRFTQVWFTATRPGEYDLFCAEYCGTEHSQMLARVIVLEEGKFEEEIERRAQWIDEVAEEQLYLAGGRIYLSTCMQCHTVQPGIRLQGPSLWDTHELLVQGGQRQFADGNSRVVDENYILDSLNVPGREIVVGYGNVMPPHDRLSTRSKIALIEFIRRLDEIELDARGRPSIPDVGELVEEEGP